MFEAICEERNSCIRFITRVSVMGGMTGDESGKGEERIEGGRGLVIVTHQGDIQRRQNLHHSRGYPCHLTVCSQTDQGKMTDEEADPCEGEFQLLRGDGRSSPQLELPKNQA